MTTPSPAEALATALEACLHCFDRMTGRRPDFVEDAVALSKAELAAYRAAPAQPSGDSGEFAKRVERLTDAIEGECDGLAITPEHAKAILEYVDRDAAGQQAEPVAKP